ncbi:MAG: dockerin type I repeat-containing protein, partial [Oscillospiraceae bacterium]|nr:dockerin type I repeat-containing protein [Oscillospiraceae bacterium]
TEDGRGYADCDGNGFKLGGGGVGSAHVVENCLAFENLNCGFTDNNNPKLGSLKNCTAYNNGIGGNGKANFMVYRCTDTVTTFDNLMSYTNADKVSKTNAKGIKLSSDKFVGEMKNSVYYNSGKYYFAKSETMTNGAKLGDVITPADSDFVTLSVPEMGTDFHTAWRNADGSPKPASFAETPSDGTYATLGYHMASGVTQTATPAVSSNATTDPIEPTPSETKPEETKPEETKPEDTKPEDTKPEDTKPEETTPTDTIVWGDANVDGQVDILDIITMNKTVLSQRKLEGQGFKNADVDQNGILEAKDSLNVMNLIVKLLTQDAFPIQ